mgnify:CR=1 FL=1
MTASPPLLLSAHTGGVLRLILNRPSARNALSSELMAALQAALEGAARDDATRVIVRALDQEGRVLPFLDDIATVAVSGFFTSCKCICGWAAERGAIREAPEVAAFC